MKRAYPMFKKALLLGVFVSLPFMFFGQNTTKKNTANKTKTTFTPYFFLQGDFGINWVNAEVTATTYVPDLRPKAFGVDGNIALGYQLNNWLSVYGNITRGFAKGRLWSQKNTYFPYAGLNLWFKSDYYGADLNAGLNLSNLFAGYKDRKFFVGFHAGLGQVQWKSILYDQVNDRPLTSYGYKGSLASHQGKGINKRKVALDIPVGFNLNYKINDKWTVYGDYTYSWLDTDIFDGVVGNKGIGGNDAIERANLGLRLNLGSNPLSSGTNTMAKKFDASFKLDATPQPLVKKGNEVAVNIKGSVDPKYMAKNAVMVIEPVLTYEGGEETLKPIILRGEDVAANGDLISYKNGGSFNYSTTIPYKKGMEAAELHASPVVYMYSGQDFTSAKQALAEGKKAVQLPDTKLADGTIITDTYVELAAPGMVAPVKPGENALVYDFAPNGYQKVTVVTNTSNLYFRVKKAKLNWRLPLNRNKENYAALKNNLSDLQKGWDLKGIEIIGWASPEGTYDFNQKLSEMRVQTAERYLKSKIRRELRKKDNGFAFNSVKDVQFTHSANGPDWNGFMKAVKNSNLKDKDAIVNVINSADESKRESEIQKMILIYPQLEKEILPELRRAIIKVNAYEPKKTDAEIEKLATSGDYTQLKINELLYAASMAQDLNTKMDIYNKAMKQYPKCWRAVANAGAVQLAMGNDSQAESLLKKAWGMNSKSAEVANSMGILQTKMGNADKAEQFFMKAQNLGAEENYNLALVNIMKGNYAKAEQLMSGVTCDYNVGLAQLLNKNYSAAANTLKCAKETANTDYLLAVVGARQDNKAMAMQYLAKAIKMDSSLAAKASKDREFLKYFNEPDFKAMVNMR